MLDTFNICIKSKNLHFILYYKKRRIDEDNINKSEQGQYRRRQVPQKQSQGSNRNCWPGPIGCDRRWGQQWQHGPRDSLAPDRTMKAVTRRDVGRAPPGKARGRFASRFVRMTFACRFWSSVPWASAVVCPIFKVFLSSPPNQHH